MSRDGLSTFLIGTALGFFILFVVTFYPAFVTCVQIHILLRGSLDIFWSSFGGFIGGMVVYYTILILYRIGRIYKSIGCWICLVLLYFITLGPFIQFIQLVYRQRSDEVIPQFDWLSLDWVSFFFN